MKLRICLFKVKLVLFISSRLREVDLDIQMFSEMGIIDVLSSNFDSIIFIDISSLFISSRLNFNGLYAIFRD